MANKPLKSIKFPGLNDTYTVPEVDATLATTGAAADAKKVGDEINDLKADLNNNNIINLCDYMPKSNKTENGITFAWSGNKCHISGQATGNAIVNMYASTNALPDLMQAGSVYGAVGGTSNISFEIYDYTGGTVKALALIGNASGIFKIPSTCTGLIVRLFVPNGTTVDETIIPLIAINGKNWSSARINYGNNVGVYDNADNFDEGIININYQILNIPYFPCIIDTHIGTNGYQLCYPLDINSYPIMMRTKNNNAYGKWVSVSEEGKLYAVDTESADETGKTNLGAAILYMLNKYKYCKLGVGAYYVAGSINMPEGSTLEGCGEASKIILTSGDAKYAIKISKFNTIKGLSLIGSYSDLKESDFDESMGSRYGIWFRKGGSDYSQNCEYCAIENVSIRNFSGCGIYQYESGSAVNQGLHVTDVTIKNCWCGINIARYSEFCRYNNLQVTFCYIAVINNGGNNTFVNCTLYAYKTAFKIDGTANNSGHGVLSNSSLCHTGNNEGTAIELSDMLYGYVFSCLQIWYNSIKITNCRGITFNAIEFSGGQKIEVNGGSTIMFTNCMFMDDGNNPPDITVNSNNKAKFINCYGENTGEPPTVKVNS